MLPRKIKPLAGHRSIGSLNTKQYQNAGMGVYSGLLCTRRISEGYIAYTQGFTGGNKIGMLGHMDVSLVGEVVGLPMKSHHPKM